MVRLETRNFTKTIIETAKLNLLAEKALRHSRRLSDRNVSLSLVFIGDKRMRRLNKEYRGQDNTTDVISFSFLGGPAVRIPQDLLGEIFISIPQARRQARKMRHSLRNEISHLFVHGLLHILGYDHKRAREANSMRRLEEKILGSIHVF